MTKFLNLFVIVIVVASVFSLQAKASGCGSYHSWLNVQRVQVHKNYSLDMGEFEVLTWGANFVRVRVNSSSELVTLPLIPPGGSETIQGQKEPGGSDDNTPGGTQTIQWSKAKLIAEDVTFEEGDGCGPVYICTTGRYTLALPIKNREGRESIKIFSWPAIEQYKTFSRENAWVANDLEKPFNSKAEEGSPLSQCAYGSW